MLEYYSGILFLTTNRVGTIDEAFKSRIHISLYYPPLDLKTTREIWKVNIKRASSRVDTDDAALLKFAKKHFSKNKGPGGKQWNGRQIFNAFQTAIALSEFEEMERKGRKSGERPVLAPSHFKEVVKTYEKFEDYLLETHGGEDDAEMNRMERIRADFYGLEDDILTPPPSNSLQRRNTGGLKSKRKTYSSSEESDSDENSADGSSSGGLSSSSDESEKEKEKAKKSKKDKIKKKKEKKKGDKKKDDDDTKSKKGKKATKSKKSDTESEASD